MTKLPKIPNSIPPSSTTSLSTNLGNGAGLNSTSAMNKNAATNNGGLNKNNLGKTAGGKNVGRYQPTAFFRKPSSLLRYRHGGYNAVFPLINGRDAYDEALDVILNQPSSADSIFNRLDKLMQDSQDSAKSSTTAEEKPMGEVIAFPKK